MYNVTHKPIMHSSQVLEHFHDWHLVQVQNPCRLCRPEANQSCSLQLPGCANG
jgi:hypothetical protein